MSDEIILMIIAYLYLGCIESAASFVDVCRHLHANSCCLEIIIWFTLVFLWLPIGVILIAVEGIYWIINYFKNIDEVDAHGFEKEKY